MRLPVWLGAAALLACAAPGAQAHAILIASHPAVGGNVSAGKLGLWLRYNSRIDAARSCLILTRPDHSQQALAIAPSSPVDVLRSDVSLSPGAYVLRWQVLAVDGHITRGDVPFTVVP